MAQKVIDTTTNNGSYIGDPAKTAFGKVNDNFSELYGVGYRRDNILGTVSQSNGVPTGSVIERGNNSNGDYIRFADGTQICIKSMDTNSTSTYQTGALWGSDAVSGNWPASFATQPRVSASCYKIGSGSSSAIWPTSFIPWSSTSAGTWRSISADNTPTNTTITLIAVGRWF